TFSSSMSSSPLRYTLFPYTTLFRSSLCFTCDAVRTCALQSTHEAKAVYLVYAGARLRAVGRPHAALRASRVSEPCHYVVKEKARSEEHTSELQSRGHLVCRLLLEKT